MMYIILLILLIISIISLFIIKRKYKKEILNLSYEKINEIAKDKITEIDNKYLKKNLNSYLLVIVGLFIISVLKIIPVIGAFVSLFSLLFLDQNFTKKDCFSLLTVYYLGILQM